MISPINHCHIQHNTNDMTSAIQNKTRHNTNAKLLGLMSRRTDDETIHKLNSTHKYTQVYLLR